MGVPLWHVLTRQDTASDSVVNYGPTDQEHILENICFDALGSTPVCVVP